MRKILLFVKKQLTLLIALTIPVALVVGAYFEVKFLKASTSWILFFMVYPMMINLNLHDVVNVIKRPKPVLMSLFINFGIVPFVAYGIGKIFLNFDPMLVVGMVLIGLIPTSGMTASWTGLAGGRLQTALVMMAVNLLLSIVMIPLYMNILLGEVVNVPTITIVLTLVKVVIVPMILGDLTRRFLSWKTSAETVKELKPVFGGISSLGVIAIVFVAIALKSRTILSNIFLVGQILVPIVIFYFVTLVISHFLSRKIEAIEDQIPLVYSVVLRNLTIALGISLASFGESMAVLLIALAYVVQLPIASFYMKWVVKTKLAPSNVL